MKTIVGAFLVAGFFAAGYYVGHANSPSYECASANGLMICEAAEP